MPIWNIPLMPNNLGEISELEEGLNGLFLFIESYKKIKKVTGDELVYLESIQFYYDRNKQTLANIKKKFNDLK